jgi:hypothetical protein
MSATVLSVLQTTIAPTATTPLQPITIQQPMETIVLNAQFRTAIDAALTTFVKHVIMDIN